MNMKRFKFEERISCLATRKVMFHSNNMNLDSSIQPYKAINVFVPSKYRKGGKGSSAYDYGVFEVKSNIGKRYGYFGWNSSISMGAALETVGYPFDKTKYEMWKCYGKVMQVHKRYFSHSADAVKSQSGSPLFSPKNKIVRGIHRGGSGVDNYAIKITADFSNLLYKRRNN